MKKNLLFAVMAGAMLAGCSDDATNPETNFPGDNDLVEVKLNAHSIEASVDPMSRALVQDDGGLSGPISLLGLAKGDDADWTKSEDILFNSVANGCIDATVTKSNNGNTVTLGDGKTTYYYPISNKKNFSFYACYPKATVSKTKDAVTANYTIDGQTDILSGSAVATGDGYNAKYFRSGGIEPTISLKHKLAALNFTIVPGNESSEDVKAVKVKSIVIKNTPTRLKLTLVDKAEGVTSVLSATQPATNEKITVFDGGNNPVNPADAPKPLAEVAAYPSDSYEVSIVLVDPNGGTFESSLPLTTPSKVAFAEGKRYNVTLTVYGMRIVKVENVTVEKWESGESIVEEVN